MFTTEYIGIVDGLQTWVVKDEQGNTVGYNQSAPEEEGTGDAEVL